MSLESFEDSFQGEPKRAERGEPKEVSADFLREVFGGRDFADAFLNAARRLEEREGSEVGFSVLKDATSDHIAVSELDEGDEHASVAPLEQFHLSEKLAEEFPDRTYLALGLLHFHPDFFDDRSSPIRPSLNFTEDEMAEGDLAALSGTRIENRENGADLMPLSMIAQQTKKGGVAILTLQEPSKFSMTEVPEDMNNLVEALRATRTQEDIIKVLEEGQYKTAFTMLSKQQLRRRDFREFAAALAKFAHMPRTIGK